MGDVISLKERRDAATSALRKESEDMAQISEACLSAASAVFDALMDLSSVPKEIDGVQELIRNLSDAAEVLRALSDLADDNLIRSLGAR